MPRAGMLSILAAFSGGICRRSSVSLVPLSRLLVGERLRDPRRNFGGSFEAFVLAGVGFALCGMLSVLAGCGGGNSAPRARRS